MHSNSYIIVWYNCYEKQSHATVVTVITCPRPRQQKHANFSLTMMRTQSCSIGGYFNVVWIFFNRTQRIVYTSTSTSEVRVPFPFDLYANSKFKIFSRRLKHLEIAWNQFVKRQKILLYIIFSIQTFSILTSRKLQFYENKTDS